ncbi:hypothetical protein D3C84_942380 [compost metagenome]
MPLSTLSNAPGASLRTTAVTPAVYTGTEKLTCLRRSRVATVGVQSRFTRPELTAVISSASATG